MEFNLESFNTIIGLAVTFNFAATILSSTDKINFITICIKNVISIGNFKSGITDKLISKYTDLKEELDIHLKDNVDPLCESIKQDCDLYITQIEGIVVNAESEFKRIFQFHHIGHLCMFLGLIGFAQLFAISYIKLNKHFWEDVILNLNVFTLLFLFLFVSIFLINNGLKRIDKYQTFSDKIKTNIDKYAVSQISFLGIIGISFFASAIKPIHIFDRDTFEYIVYYFTPFVTFLCFIAHFFILIIKAMVHKNKILAKKDIADLKETLSDNISTLKTAKKQAKKKDVNNDKDPYDVDSVSKPKPPKKKK